MTYLLTIFFYFKQVLTLFPMLRALVRSVANDVTFVFPASDVDLRHYNEHC